MAEPSLKVVPEAPSTDAAKADATKADANPTAKKPSRKRLRMILLIVLPLLALAGGAAFYLGTGRYITTDNAYVGAQKVLITPDISGKVSRVIVREGQHVKAGDELFDIDRQPFQIAVDMAQAKLAAVRTDFTNLKSDYQIYSQLADVAQQNAELKKRDVER
jgi:membrane fusion protein (multidrug efflux system)